MSHCVFLFSSCPLSLSRSLALDIFPLEQIAHPKRRSADEISIAASLVLYLTTGDQASSEPCPLSNNGEKKCSVCGVERPLAFVQLDALKTA